MRKLNILLLVLSVAIILTGCDLFGSDESINAQNDIVVINFDSHSAKGMSLNTQYPEVTELYWSYTAEKKDNKPKYGEKLAPANIKDGTGCNKNIEFSTGKWEFVLYGFTTADARTQSNTVELAEKNCTYTGNVEKELKKTDTAVTVYTAVNSNSDTYGTIKVSVTTSPTNSNKTIKYYITNANGYSTTWTSVKVEHSVTCFRYCNNICGM